MNYTKIYDQLISRGRNRALTGYKESHHIVPRCMGGSDSKDNLVDLTPEEHYLAHQLLVRMYPEDRKLVYAASAMLRGRPMNKMYGWLKRRFSETISENQSGTGNSQYGTIWIHNGTEARKIRGDIPDGWYRGKSFKKEKAIRAKKIDRAAKAEAKKEARRAELRVLHSLYVEKGFKAVTESGYTYSKQNLVMAFAKYLPEFIPQNGKTRK